MTKKMLIIILCMSFFISGCESIGDKSLLPEEIIATAIETNEEVKDYYMVSTMEIYLNDELVDEMVTKEWSGRIYGDLKRRTETTSKEDGKTISVMDEKEAIIYQEDTNEVFTMTYEIEEIGNLNKSLKRRTMDELAILKKQYTIKNLGEEEINGIKTFHLKGIPKKEDSLFGDYEMWIDKDNWLVVKSITSTGDQKIITKNKEIDFSPKLQASMFKLDIPEDAELVNIDDFSPDIEEITIEEANKELNGRLLYVKDQIYKLEKVQYLRSKSEDMDDEIIFDYSKDGENLFNITVIKRSKEEMQGFFEANEQLIRGHLAFIEEDVISLRQDKGLVSEGILNIITFYENELMYSLVLEENKITIQEAIDVIEKMEIYK